MQMYSRKIFGLALAVMASTGSAAYALTASEITGIREFREMVAKNESMLKFFTQHQEIYQKVSGDTGLQLQLVDGTITLDELIMMESSEAIDTIDAGFNRAARDDINEIVRSGAKPAPVMTRPPVVDEAKPYLPLELPYTIDPSTDKPDTAKPGSADNEPIYGLPWQGSPGNGVPGGGTTTPPMVDINAPIDAAKAALDERGWPRYLRVPANCPAANDTKQYYFHHRHDRGNSGFGGGNLDVYNGRFISPWEGYNAGAISYMNSTDSEIHAIPLNFPANKPDFILATMAADAPTLSNGDMWRISVSTCPGTFGSETGVIESGGEEGLGSLTIALPVLDGRPLGTAPNLRPTLKPGERYFLNLKTSGGCNALADSMPGDGSVAIARRMVKGRNEAVCSTIITPEYLQNNFNKPLKRPYAGPCLSQGPYPENYNSYFCQGSTYGANNTGEAGITVMRWHCADTLNKAAPENFEVRKVNGSWSWTLGANKPVYPSSICAFDMHYPMRTEPIKTWEELAASLAAPQ